MKELIFELQDDLAKKFDQLCAIHHHPALFVSEHFFDLRNAIDYDAEKTMMNILSGTRAEFQSPDDQDSAAAKTNVVRNELIEFLKRLETKIMQELPAGIPNSNDPYADLKQRVDQFAALNDPALNTEEVYVQLALDLVSLTNELEKRVFRSQSIFYVPPNKEDFFGVLVYSPRDFLTRQQVAFLK